MRFSQFMKGFFFYNTIYWRRASDDLDIQRMSREERANLRPKRNLDIIRPRERARANAARSVLSMPGGEYSEPPAPETAPPLVQVSLPPSEIPEPPTAASEDTVVEIHRRKKRRSSRHSKVMPKHYYQFSESGRGGLLRWLFKK